MCVCVCVFSQIEEIADNVSSVNERLETCTQQARLFNSREGLFNKNSTDYSRVGQITKAFEPFSNLWTTTAAWVVNKKKWMDGAFGDIESRPLEDSVMNGVKLINKVTRALRDKEMPQVLAVAEQIKAVCSPYSSSRNNRLAMHVNVRYAKSLSAALALTSASFLYCLNATDIIRLLLDCY